VHLLLFRLNKILLVEICPCAWQWPFSLYQQNRTVLSTSLYLHSHTSLTTTVMRTCFTRFAASFLLLFVLLSSTDMLAATPYTRAVTRGRAYSHRPFYKQYQGTKHRGFMSLFHR